MADALDLVRRLFDAINRGDADAVAALYDPACIVEHVFTDDDGIHEGVDRVRAGWAAEFEQFAAAGPGARRVSVARVSGLETGWGWARADWSSVVRGRDGRERHRHGYSHVWVEDGRIRRHRSVAREGAPPAPAPPSAAASQTTPREYPVRPIVGVGAVVLTDEGQVVLVKRRYEPLAGQWSLPGGSLETGETLEAGTAREVEEETGLVVDVGPLVEVFDRILVDEAGRVRYHYVLLDYLCRPRAGTLHAGSDVTEAVAVPSRALAPYRLTEKSLAVIHRALELAGGAHDPR